MRPIELCFDAGTIVVPHVPEGVPREALEALLARDERTGVLRAPAQRYRDVVLGLRARGIAFTDRARAFEPLSLSLREQVTPYPHQRAALDAWIAAGKRGIVELPTGAGKTLLAVLAIERVLRPTLVVVPTIDLLEQWQRVLSSRFGEAVGVIGGGERTIERLTVTTYDSAAFQTEHLGNRFGFLVCDECHHLPAPAYRFIGAGSLAPFRLGLTATLARADGGERTAEALLGPLCYSVPIDALEGDYLAPYEVVSVEVELLPDEQRAYDEARGRYLDFLRGSRISLSAPGGWSRFIMRSQQSEEGRAALRGYREQRKIAFTSAAKIDALWGVLLRHAGDRVIVFADDNETVFALSKKLLLPAITHHTKVPERRALLDAFARGDLVALLTSRVLNEGVDVPEASVGVVLSGTGSVREHVQRLGRILRKRPGKRAILYEILTRGTAEAGVSERRRRHRAYEQR